MGRRSIHTAEELRELIIDAATGLIVADGLSGLSAREIARRINYSPGTIYNVFENLDDLVLTVESRLLDRLAARLADVSAIGDPRTRILRLAETYLDFTHENPKLWNLLFEHRLPAGREVPSTYQHKLTGLMTFVEEALAPLVDPADPETLKRSARVLWAGVHGITSLSTADKLSNVTTESARPLVHDLVSTYLDGIERRKHAPPGP